MIEIGSLQFNSLLHVYAFVYLLVEFSTNTINIMHFSNRNFDHLLFSVASGVDTA